MTANQLTWAIISLLALACLYQTGPKIAYELGRGLAPTFVTLFDSSQFDHTRGRWDIETARKVKK